MKLLKKTVRVFISFLLILAFLGTVGAAERGQISLGQALAQLLVTVGSAGILLGGG